MARFPDRRPRIREAAWRDPNLTWRERAFLVRVTEIPAETDDDGRRRRGSHAMAANGQFSLSHDHIAAHMGTTGEVVRQIVKALSNKGRKPTHYLDLVARGRYGRPNTYHALMVDKTTGLTADKTTGLTGQTVDPKLSVNPDKTTGLTYTTCSPPTVLDHNGAHASDGDPRSPEQRLGETEGQDADARLTAPRPQPHADKEATA